MKMTHTPTPPFQLRTLYAPGTPPVPEVPSPWPDSDVDFRGWGSIGGRGRWPTNFKEHRQMMREILRGIGNSASTTKSMVVVGCEWLTKCLAEDRKRQPEAHNLLKTVVHGMKAVHGVGVEVALSGPEERIAGDFKVPMIGKGTTWDTDWNDSPPLPFISPIYGASAEHVGHLLARMTLAAGLKRGVVLWVQEPKGWRYTPAEHRAETFIWARAVCGHAAQHQAAMIAAMPAETEGAE